MSREDDNCAELRQVLEDYNGNQNDNDKCLLELLNTHYGDRIQENHKWKLPSNDLLEKTKDFRKHLLLLPRVSEYYTLEDESDNLLFCKYYVVSESGERDDHLLHDNEKQSNINGGLLSQNENDGMSVLDNLQDYPDFKLNLGLKILLSKYEQKHLGNMRQGSEKQHLGDHADGDVNASGKNKEHVDLAGNKYDVLEKKLKMKGLVYDELSWEDTENILMMILYENRPDRSKWSSFNRIGQEDLYNSLEHVLNVLRSYQPYSGPFINRVNRREVPDYHLIIKTPMNIHTMSTKLKNLEYNSKNEFIRDFDMIIKNCFTYNKEGSIYRSHALKLQEKAILLWPSIPDIVIQNRTTKPFHGSNFSEKTKPGNNMLEDSQDGNKERTCKLFKIPPFPAYSGSHSKMYGDLDGESSIELESIPIDNVSKDQEPHRIYKKIFDVIQDRFPFKIIRRDDNRVLPLDLTRMLLDYIGHRNLSVMKDAIKRRLVFKKVFGLDCDKMSPLYYFENTDVPDRLQLSQNLDEIEMFKVDIFGKTLRLCRNVKVMSDVQKCLELSLNESSVPYDEEMTLGDFLHFNADFQFNSNFDTVVFGETWNLNVPPIGRDIPGEMYPESWFNMVPDSMNNSIGSVSASESNDNVLGFVDIVYRIISEMSRIHKLRKSILCLDASHLLDPDTSDVLRKEYLLKLFGHYKGCDLDCNKRGVDVFSKSLQIILLVMGFQGITSSCLIVLTQIAGEYLYNICRVVSSVYRRSVESYKLRWKRKNCGRSSIFMHNQNAANYHFGVSRENYDKDEDHDGKIQLDVNSYSIVLKHVLFTTFKEGGVGSCKDLINHIDWINCKHLERISSIRGKLLSIYDGLFDSNGSGEGRHHAEIKTEFNESNLVFGNFLEEDDLGLDLLGLRNMGLDDIKIPNKLLNLKNLSESPGEDREHANNQPLEIMNLLDSTDCENLTD